MALMKLPDDIQHSINASSINTFNRAVEELVYNSIDAGATSIAVRVNVKEYFIQVIDNGFGLNVKDLQSMGKTHMTSKFEQNRPKAEPKYYGFHGQSIATIAKVSQELKITTRCNGGTDTWSKVFINGLENNIKQVEERPSKGTTVEIKGFLYNAVIRRKTVEELNELNNIKSFIEKLALINTNLSLTLRDNSSNEILLSIHKNRDILQTLSLLYGININKLKELQVEKNHFKVKAFIITDNSYEGKNRYHWIYLNRFFLKNRRIRNVFNGLMKKYLRSHSNDDKIAKTKPFQEDTEKILNKQTIPSYFIFITCPYDEYDYSRSPKQSFLEFKNWDYVNNILEKLIKFYVGDLKVKDNSIFQINNNHKTNTEDTRNQVKKIIERVLGNRSKKAEILQMQNGIKGKYVKRKKRKKNYCSKNEKHSIRNLHNNENTCVVNAKPVIDMSKLIVPHSSDPRLKDLKPNLTTESNNILSPVPMNIEQQDCILKNNRMVSRNGNNLLNSAYDFRKGCAALKRKCDELELQVDQILMRQTKKKSKKCTDINKNEESKTKYSNVISNIMLRKTIESVMIQKHNIYGTSPYFPPHNPYGLGKSITPYRGYSRDFGCRWNVPPNCLKPYENNTFILPFAKSTSFHRHQQLTSNTFQSHNFNLRSENHNYQIRKFISEQSIDNFGPKNEYFKSRKNKRNKNTGYSYNFLLNHRPDNNFNIDLRTASTSYTIEFSRSNEYEHCDQKFNSSRRHSTIKNDNRFCCEKIEKEQSFSTENMGFTNKRTMKNIITPRSNGFLDTYTNNIFSTNLFECQKKVIGCTRWQYSKENNLNLDLSAVNSNYDYQSVKATDALEIYRGIDNVNSYCHLTEKTPSLSVYQEFQNNIASIQVPVQNSDVNVVFVSEAQQENNSNRNKIVPVELCEGLLNDSDCLALEENKTLCFVSNHNRNVKDTYHSMFNSEIENDLTERFNRLCVLNSFDHDSLLQFNLTEELKNNEEQQYNMPSSKIQMPQKSNINSTFFAKTFEIRDRQRFLPKGMSPLNNCETLLNKCKSHFDKEYFDASIYYNFLDDLKIHSDIYEPHVQNMKGIGTKEIQKFENKVIKDNASLRFDGKFLDKANVLGQVDNKFIAAEIEGHCNQTKAASTYLVLFDQHAVHERIRLENKLLDYLEDENWKSVEIYNITLQLTKEEILYLHNYKDKFAQFGLKWSLLKNEKLVINGIPEAILGKNPRQENKIMLAIKNVILEIIKSLQIQRGCVPLYLKTIMDLVSSEACRYAIKFGDKLTIDECKELLRDLSHCKTPFQCAHGRPVMAVLMKLKKDSRKEVLINRDKLLDFHKRTLKL